MLGGIVAGFAASAFKTSGLLRIVLSASALVLLAALAWSGIVTYTALLARRVS